MPTDPHYFNPQPGGPFYSPESEAIGALTRLANDLTLRTLKLHEEIADLEEQYANCLRGIDRINARLEDQVRLSNEIVDEIIAEERAGK